MRVEHRKVWLVELDHFERDMLVEILALSREMDTDGTVKEFAVELEQKMATPHA